MCQLYQSSVLQFFRAQETVTEINEAAGAEVALALQGDVSNEADVKASVERCVAAFGRIDSYFANAGIMPKYAAIEDTTEESFMRCMRINTLGPFFAIKHASAAMQEAGEPGSIVCTASIAAIRADVTPLEYSASKGAVIAMVRSSADRLLGTGVRVNCVVPGGVVSNITQQVAMEMDERGQSLKGYDMEAFPPADPTEIGKVVRFLASEDSAFINGQAIVADGGMSNSMGFRLVKKKRDVKNTFQKGMSNKPPH